LIEASNYQAEVIDMQIWALPEAYLHEWEERKARSLVMPALGEQDG